MECRCGCKGGAVWLGSGTDYGGFTFTDEPMCDSAASYCEEAAEEAELPFTKRRIN